MRKKKSKVFCGLLVSVFLLISGCGDDLTVSVPVSEEEIVSIAQSAAETEADKTQQEEVAVTQEEAPATEESATEEPATEESATEGSSVQTEPPQESESVAEEETITITISAAGDCSLGNYFEQNYSNSFNQTYEQTGDPGYFFQNVKNIFEADDMTIVNLEGVLTRSEVREEGRTYNIKGDPSYVEILTAGSVEAVSMGNNHRMDYGTTGTKDTVAALEGAGIVYAYDDVIGIYEIKGIRIGYVSVNEVAWGTGCERFIKEGIAKLQEQEADLIIACCHWGIEKDNFIEEYQSTLGRICIDAGADLVLGHHPHVLQGIDIYNGKYIVYSLANFSFGANRNPTDKDTMIFQQTFTFVDGELQEDADACVIPCSVSSVKERNNYQPTPLTEEASANVIERLNQYSAPFGVSVAEDGSILYDMTVSEKVTPEEIIEEM